jgi:predicted negative regulator of RcsB-dependent stress response
LEGYESEKEQVEALKKWWKDNGSSLVTGVLLGLAVLFGVKAWFGYQERQAESASNLYTQFMNALAQQDTDTLTKAGSLLIADFGSTPYAPLAALGLAKVQLESGETEAARVQLQWALEHADQRFIAHSARLRLVRLLIAEGDLDAAASRLAEVADPGEYAALYAELRGDIALARGDLAAAHAAYGQALAAAGDQALNRPLLQTKFNDTALEAAD